MLLLAPYGTNRVKKTNNWDNCEAADKMNIYLNVWKICEKQLLSQSSVCPSHGQCST